MSEAGAGEETSYRVAVSADEDGPSAVFEHLWTPYRMAYIRGEGKPNGVHDCPFCVIPTMSDEDGLMVARGAHVYVVLNLYPYNPGHAMVVPYRKVADLEPGAILFLNVLPSTLLQPAWASQANVQPNGRRRVPAATRHSSRAAPPLPKAIDNEKKIWA